MVACETGCVIIRRGHSVTVFGNRVLEKGQSVTVFGNRVLEKVCKYENDVATGGVGKITL